MDPKPHVPLRSSKKLAHPLPTVRLAFPKHLELLRGYAIAGADGSGVQNRKLAELVGINFKTTSLANAFFFDVGFIQRGDKGVIPAQEVIAFQQAYQWNPEGAAEELAPLIEKSWFAGALIPALRFNPLSEEAAVSTMAKAIGAGPEVKTELRLLLDYLEAANLIVRADGMVQFGRDITPQRPLARVSEQPEPSTRTVTPEPSPGASRGALPLLIQGLLEQLPRNGEWSRAGADKWLELAKLTFEVVYDFNDATREGAPEEAS